MARMVAPTLPGYSAGKKFLEGTELSVFIRQVRELRRATTFFNATFEPSRMFNVGRVRKGTVATFSERDSVKALPGVRLHGKGSGAASEASCPGLVSLEKTETGKGPGHEETWRNGQVGGGEGLRGALGLSRQAKQALGHELWTLSGFKRRLGMWTVSLPTEAIREMHGRDGAWKAFENRVHKELSRRLALRLGVVFWVSVTEIQMKRSAKLGLPCPHLHIVFVGRHGGRRVGPWVLGKEDFDDIIRVSLKTALGRDDFPLKSAGKVHRIKKDAEKYLTKYMSKSGDEVERWNRPEVAGGLRVHRWRHSSSALKARAAAHTPELHGNVAWWALGQAGLLEELGIAKVTEWEADDFRPAGVRIQALRRDGIALIWNTFRDLDPEWTGEECPYFPRKRAIANWGEWDYRRGPLRVSRNVAVKRGTDVVALLSRSVPSSYLEPDDGPIKMGERISSPVTDVLKERFEHLYREVDVPEPVFLRSRSFGIENQLKLPIELNAVGSSWDVGAPGSWDPYWDDPDWRGGSPRRVPG